VDTSLQLPSSVFGSTVETKVGLLNQAAPMPGIRAVLMLDYCISLAKCRCGC